MKAKVAMRFKPIIKSLLEIDLYKFSMGQTIFHQFSTYTTRWTFKCRNKDVFFTPEMVEEIKNQIKNYCKLRFTEEELRYLKTIRWLNSSYIDFLRYWYPRFEEFEITTNAECGLSIETEGTWLSTTMYEIPVLAIVNEVYFRMKYDYDTLYDQFREKLDAKIKMLCSEDGLSIGAFSEFGLRRRLSGESQDYLIKKLIENAPNFKDSTFAGTSNVFLAKKYGIKPVGTMAHEWIMCVGQGNPKHNPAYSNDYALRSWVDEYGVLNGIALTDTITTDCFLKDFDEELATVFTGVRHDSGDPFVWGDKMIEHYKKLGLDPTGKTLLFSDSLDFEKAAKIYSYFKGRARVAFGIGTYLSNDTSVKALNIVMKTTRCNNTDVAKISDTPGKGMCKNPEYVDYLQRTINWRMNHD